MPKSKKKPAAKAIRHNRPYLRPVNRNDLTGTSRNNAPNSVVVPFEKLDIGSFYNCAIAFIGNNPGGKVPPALPKYRVLVGRISEESHTVEVYYVTTFAGKHNPVIFHKRCVVPRWRFRDQANCGPETVTEDVQEWMGGAGSGGPPRKVGGSGSWSGG